MIGAFLRLFIGAVVGRVLGFAREIAIAAAFGTSAVVAAFRTGLTAVVLPTHAIASDALASAFVPQSARYLKEDPARAHALFWSVFAIMSGLGVLIAGILIVGARVLVRIVAPGFPPNVAEQTVAMVRIMALGVPFYIQGGQLANFAMATGEYTLASMRAALQNVGYLAGIALAVVFRSPLMLAWGFSVYAALYAGAGYIGLVRHRAVAGPRAFNRALAREVATAFAKAIAPLLVVPLIAECGVLAERAVASLVSLPTAAALDYAKTLTETGIALIGIPLGNAGLAALAPLTDEEARARLKTSLLPTITAMAAASAFIAINSEAAVRVLFARGAFGAESVHTTSRLVAAYGIGLWAQIAGYVLMRALNARGRHKESMVAAVAYVAVVVAADFGLYRWLGGTALGLGATAGATAMMVVSAARLGVLGAVGRMLLLVIPGVALYCPLAWAVRGPGLLSLALSAFVAFAFWLAYAMAVPSLRKVLLGVVRSLAGRRLLSLSVE